MVMQDRPTVMVSSTVYRYEELLDQIFGVLNGLGYTVWMSYRFGRGSPLRNRQAQSVPALRTCDGLCTIAVRQQTRMEMILAARRVYVH